MCSNPLILCNSDQEDALKFTIVKTEDSTCDLDELELRYYDKNKLVIVPPEIKGCDSERNYILRLAKDQKASSSYHVNIYDPANEECVILTVVNVTR